MQMVQRDGELIEIGAKPQHYAGVDHTSSIVRSSLGTHRRKLGRRPAYLSPSKLNQGLSVTLGPGRTSGDRWVAAER